jgi:phosphoglucosamine mutase
MRRDGYNFGGEQSGHLIFLERSSSGDGILTALQTLRVMLQKGRKLSDLAGSIEKYPQVIKNVEVKSKPPLEGVDPISKAMEEAGKELGARGRLLVRHSGTQMLCRVMAEGEDPELVRKVVDRVADTIDEHLR